ncbi:hypothetical protein ACHQM5_027569 [Ranunculus cassubicifolius]
MCSELEPFSSSQDYRDMNCGWKELPPELIELMLSSFYIGDSLRFRLTCKTWMSITPPVKTSHLILHSNPEAQKIPWLMSFPYINKGVCNFHHPIYGDSFTMNIPKLADAIILESKFGWLLMLRGETSVFFSNPLTAEIIELPDLEYNYALSGISFSAPPTASECIIFGHDVPTFDPKTICVLVYRMVKENENNDSEANTWSSRFFDIEYEFMSSLSNPVYDDGIFYCLSQDGKLAIFDTMEEECNEWQILPLPPLFSCTEKKKFKKPVKSFLVEYKGKILSVFLGFKGKPLWVYELDRQGATMRWVRRDCLGDEVIFLSPTGCMLLPACLKGIQSRIYFSRFHEENNVFYSLSTRQYHCFKCVYCGKDCKGTCELGNCTWIQLAE